MSYLIFPISEFLKKSPMEPQIEPKHVAVNKSIKTHVLCD